MMQFDSQRMKIQRRRLLLAAASATLAHWPVSGAENSIDAMRAPGPLRVVATFSVLADIARELGGPAVEVTSLVGPNADAHVFEPTPSDVQRVARAQLVITNGLRFEGWIDRLIAASGYRGPIVVASRGVTVRHSAGGADPHAWQDLANGQRYAENISTAMLAATSPRAPRYALEIRGHTADYLRRLEVLDRDIRARIAAIPPERRRVITSHDAFGYFADAYGVTFIAPRGWTTGSEPSAKAVAAIVRQARASKASALLVENISDPRLIERIGRESGLKVGGALYSDALSPVGTEADTYVRMFEHNVKTLVDAMSLNVPGASVDAGAAPR